MIFKNINISFKEKFVFNNAELHLQKGKITSLIGLNGSGKTTLLKFILNEILNKKTLDIDIKNCFYQESERLYLPRITGGEYLKFRRNLLKTDFCDFDKIENFFNIPLDKYIENYSTGMKRKLEFAPSLFQNYDLYIFDEPFSGLDLESKEQAKNSIKQFAEKGKYVLVVTHDMNYSDEHSDVILQIEKSKIIEVQDTDFITKKVLDKIDNFGV